MLLTLEGIYKDGKVELSETPANVTQAKVLVTFLPAERSVRPRKQMVCGQFAGQASAGRVMSTDEDFRMAEWRGEEANGH